jgi:signal transduction histidine kinase
VLEETDKLLATFNALLAIARAESGQVREGLEPLDAAAVVREVAELYEPSVEEAGGTITVAPTTPAWCRPIASFWLRRWPTSSTMP